MAVPVLISMFFLSAVLGAAWVWPKSGKGGLPSRVQQQVAARSTQPAELAPVPTPMPVILKPEEAALDARAEAEQRDAERWTEEVKKAEEEAAKLAAEKKPVEKKPMPIAKPPVIRSAKEPADKKSSGKKTLEASKPKTERLAHKKPPEKKLAAEKRSRDRLAREKTPQAKPAQERQLAASKPQPATVQRPAEAADAWRTALRADMQACNRQVFLARYLCQERSRRKYCPGHWDKTEDCRVYVWTLDGGKS